MEFSRRKWGYYLTVYSAKRFKIKFLYFKKDTSCSMQRHFKRSETWCFLFGKGLFWKDSKSNIVKKDWIANVEAGSSVCLAMRDWHMYVAQKPTLVLEIQTGICEESDIERAA